MMITAISRYGKIDGFCVNAELSIYVCTDEIVVFIEKKKSENIAMEFGYEKIRLISIV